LLKEVFSSTKKNFTSHPIECLVICMEY
jgi:hypothetical protein